MRDLQRLKRRIDHAHISAFGAHVEQVNGGTWHAQHVTIRCEDNFGAFGNCQGAVNLLKRSHAHRTAWSVHQLNSSGQHVIQAVMQEGVSLSAADFHQRPRAGNSLADLFQQSLYLRGVAVFVNVFHRMSARHPARRFRAEGSVFPELPLRPAR